MKPFARPGLLLLLWTVAAVLLLAGAYATHAARVPARTPSPHDARVAAVAPIDAAAAATASVQQVGRRLRDTGAVETPLHLRLVSVLGMVVLLLLGWLLSVNRALVPWRIILWGIGLQLVFALFILKTPVGEWIFSGVNDGILALLGFTTEGARFLFGNLVVNNVPVASGEPGMGPAPPIAGMVANTGAFFAFNVLPTIVFFSSLTTLLYYFGVMQAVVKVFAWVMIRTMRTSGAETLSAAGNIFLGQTEAPLLVRPYVAGMTMSELMAVMTGGFATVAGGVMAAYVGMLFGYFRDIAGHLMAASVMSAPAALVFAKLMYPEVAEPATRGQLHVQVERVDANPIDAAARGAGEGLHLALNVGAMLLAFIALVALLDALIGLLGEASIPHVGALAEFLRNVGWLAEGQRLSLRAILGWLFAPLAWVMGVPWSDATTVGALLGVKTAVNEFVAYIQLSGLLASDADLAPRSVVIATYALCGFANFSSIAIQIGGLSGMAPARRSDLARLGLRAMIAGSLAAFMTATIAGILV
jgi:concentrative nucleoside transporter, CNT family